MKVHTPRDRLDYLIVSMPSAEKLEIGPITDLCITVKRKDLEQTVNTSRIPISEKLDTDGNKAN